MLGKGVGRGFSSDHPLVPMKFKTLYLSVSINKGDSSSSSCSGEQLIG